MAMNLLHQRRCSSVGWADMVRDELVPWALADVELGDQTLEIGPGYGATLRALVERAGAVTAVEVDKPMAERLDRLYGDRARVIHGDGSNTGLPDTSFASVVCFTMLHHVPTDRLQDQLFAEAFRVLRPGGVFAFPVGAPPPVTSRWYWALAGFDLAMRVRNAVWRPPFVMYYRTCPLSAVQGDLTASGFTVTTLPLTALGRREDGSPKARLVLARTAGPP